MNRNVTATILIVLAIGIYFTVTENMWKGVKSVKAVNNQYISAIANAEKLIAVRDKVLKDWKNISEEDQEKLDKMIPNTVDNIRLIIDLNSVALRHGFSLRNIKAAVSSKQSPAKVAPTDSSAGSAKAESNIIPSATLDTVTVSFGVTASYNDFQSFLQDLEADLRIMELTHLSITSNDTGTYDFGVEMQTYWLRQQ